MQFPLHIELHRSKLLFFLLLLIHATAAIACGLLPWPLPGRGVLLLLVLLSLVRALRRPRVVGLRVRAHDRLECRLADGRWVSAAVRAESSVFAQLVVLRLQLDEGEDDSKGGTQQRRCALVILPDQLDAQDFRRLRVCLRWQADGEPRSRRSRPPTAGNDADGPAV